MAATRIAFLDPTADGVTAKWASFGAASDWQGVNKGVRTPTAPSNASGIQSSTNSDIEQIRFGTGAAAFALLNPGESISYLRLWLYIEGTVPANHTVNVALSYEGTASGQDTVIATSTAGWVSTPKLSPFRGDAHHLSTNDNIQAQLVLNEGAAQAANTVITAAYVEVGLSTMEHIIPSGKHFMGQSTGQRYTWAAAQYPSLVFDGWMAGSDVAGIESIFRNMRNRGLKMARVFVPFGVMMTDATTVNETSWVNFEAFLGLAEKQDIRLNITGLCTFLGPTDTSHVPTWLDALSEANRNLTFGRWWKRCAQACAGRPTVVLYDIINEPVAGDAQPDWYLGAAPFYYAGILSQSLAARTVNQVKAAFFTAMKTQIRLWDSVKPVAFADHGLPPTFGPDAENAAISDVSIPHKYLRREDGRTVASVLSDLRANYIPLNKPVLIEESGDVSTAPSPENAQDLFRNFAWMMEAGQIAGYSVSWPNALGGYSTGAFTEWSRGNAVARTVKRNRVAGVVGRAGRIGTRNS